MECARLESGLVLEFEESDGAFAIAQHVMDLLVIPDPIDAVFVTGTGRLGIQTFSEVFGNAVHLWFWDRHVSEPVNFSKTFGGIDVVEKMTVNFPEFHSETRGIAGFGGGRFRRPDVQAGIYRRGRRADGYGLCLYVLRKAEGNTGG